MKVAIITGARGGIGAAIAEKLKDEYTVVGWDAKEGGPAVNVADSADVLQAAANVIAKYGRIDLLVNAAGITRDKTFRKMTDADWDAVIAVNLTGTKNCCKAVLEPMIAQGGGHIVNIASIVGITGNACQANYAASKAAVIAFTKTLAAEQGPKGIIVNAIAPGFTDTEMVARVPKEIVDTYIARTPLKRLAKPAEIAQAVEFLASHNFVTGHTLVVDGGLTLGF